MNARPSLHRRHSAITPKRQASFLGIKRGNSSFRLGGGGGAGLLKRNGSSTRAFLTKSVYNVHKPSSSAADAAPPKMSAFSKSDVKLSLSSRLGAFAAAHTSKKKNAKIFYDWTAFSKLAKQRKFDEIMCILKKKNNNNNNNEQDLVHVWLDDCPNPLHVVLYHRPPVELVRLLMDTICAYKKGGFSPQDSVNVCGQTPLHIAVTSNCDVAVIEFLLSGNTTSSAAMVLDDQERTPLHWACKSITKKNAENMSSIIRHLLQAYGHARTIPDSTNQTPLDLARRQKANQNVLCSLVVTTLNNNNDKNALKSSSCSATSAMTDGVPHEISYSMDDMSSIESFVRETFTTQNEKRRRRRRSDKKNKTTRRSVPSRKSSKTPTIATRSTYSKVSVDNDDEDVLLGGGGGHKSFSSSGLISDMDSMSDLGYQVVEV